MSADVREMLGVILFCFSQKIRTDYYISLDIICYNKKYSIMPGHDYYKEFKKLNNSI